MLICTRLLARTTHPGYSAKVANDAYAVKYGDPRLTAAATTNIRHSIVADDMFMESELCFYSVLTVRKCKS